MPDGRIGHAELDLGDGATMMLADEYPEIGVTAPTPDHGAAVTLYLNVRDVDTTLATAIDAGATLDRPAADYDYGRNGVILDPFGHRWMIAGPRAAGGVRQGDVGYVSLWVPDAAAAATFYAAVLGWRYGPAHAQRSRQVVDQALHHGVWESPGRPNLFVCFAVADLDMAAESVRAAGGQAEAPQSEPYGQVSMCVDDQGSRFALFQPPDGVGTTPRAGPPRHGDLAYVTYEVVDSERARRFYTAVLGWRFSPGRVEDGWQIDGVVPMGGLRGDCDEATTVPMYAVDDVEAAIEAVRGAGGVADDAEQQPYGLTTSCTDNQGTRFDLGQF
jgi:predicted enzyme related to lactoylglutathione lyase